MELLNGLFSSSQLMTDVNGLFKRGFPDSPLAIFDFKWVVAYRMKTI